MGIYTTANNWNFSWDTIWQKQSYHNRFWLGCEMKIPYAALRFPKSEKQTWGLNFYRS